MFNQIDSGNSAEAGGCKGRICQIGTDQGNVQPEFVKPLAADHQPAQRDIDADDAGPCPVCRDQQPTTATAGIQRQRARPTRQAGGDIASQCGHVSGPIQHGRLVALGQRGRHVARDLVVVIKQLLETAAACGLFQARGLFGLLFKVQIAIRTQAKVCNAQAHRIDARAGLALVVFGRAAHRLPAGRANQAQTRRQGACHSIASSAWAGPRR